MVETWLPWALVVVMLLASAWARARLPADARLPMAWGLDGMPIWRAPRLAAVLFTPSLASVVFLATQALAPAGGARALLLVAPLFLAVHVIHLVRALRDVEAGR